MIMEKCLNMDKKMTTYSHCRGSKRSHNEKRKSAKENGMWKKMSNEEYHRDKAEIRIHLNSLMELVLRSREY